MKEVSYLANLNKCIFCFNKKSAFTNNTSQFAKLNYVLVVATEYRAYGFRAS